MKASREPAVKKLKSRKNEIKTNPKRKSARHTSVLHEFFDEELDFKGKYW